MLVAVRGTAVRGTADSEHIVSSVASGDEQVIYTWNAFHGYPENTLQGGKDGVVAMAWHPDLAPMQLLALGASGKVYIWAKARACPPASSLSRAPLAGFPAPEDHLQLPFAFPRPFDLGRIFTMRGSWGTWPDVCWACVQRCGQGAPVAVAVAAPHRWLQCYWRCRS